MVSVSKGNSNAGAPVISHLPFLWDESQIERPLLLSHMARANPHWQLFEEGSPVTVAFQGPHAYVSPAWYTENPLNVPTWNYAVVHVSGTPRILNGPKAAASMRRLVGHFEGRYGSGWNLDEAALAAKLEHIVVFEIEVTGVDAKFKLSQQQSPENRDRVTQALLESPHPEIHAVGDLMARVLPPEKKKR